MINCIGVLRFACCFALAVIALPASAQDARLESIPACRDFAQKFYAWYVPIIQKSLNGPTFEIAIRNKAAVFSPELLTALRLDAQAQARAKGEIVGIDFDPFVGGQDPADHYVVGKISIRNQRCFAEIWRDSATDRSAKSSKPDAIAELAQRDGHWEFVNFHYPEVSANLMRVLALLRKDGAGGK